MKARGTPIVLALLGLASCDRLVQGDADGSGPVRILPRLIVNGNAADTTLPVVDSVHAQLTIDGKLIEQGAAWSTHELDLPGVPVGKEYALALKGLRRNADSSAWIEVWKSQNVNGVMQPLKDVDFLEEDVSISVGDTIAPVLSRFDFQHDTTLYPEDSSIALHFYAKDTAGGSAIRADVNNAGVLLSDGSGTVVVALSSGETKTIKIRVLDANNNATFQTVVVRRPLQGEVVAVWDRALFDQVVWH